MQFNYPGVSIIILTYNAGRYIEALLDSLSDQSYPRDRMEIIVVDNASIDDTLSLVENRYSHVKLVPLDNNVGFAAGNNHGLEFAQYDFLAFLNQDTICHQDWLKELMDKLREDSEVVACNSNIIPTEFDDVDRIDRESKVNLLYFCDLSLFGYGHYRTKNIVRYVPTRLLSGCSFIIRKKMVTDLGYLFDEQLWMYAEDTDLSLRIHNLGKRICVVRDSIVYHLHDNKIKVKGRSLYISARAIMNRVHVFFKNMGSLEFLLFCPFLFFGGVFKILEFPLATSKKALYFIPFALFSMASMFVALFGLPGFTESRRLVLKKRLVTGFPILRLIMGKRWESNERC